MSILQVDLKMPGGTYKQLPLFFTTTFVWYVPSNFSSALKTCGVSMREPRRKIESALIIT